MSLNLGELRALLDGRQCGYPDDTLVQATAPWPHSHTFEITYLTGSLTNTAAANDVVTLHLTEVNA